MKTYEIIDHTADLGIKVYGRDLEELFINSADAMFEVILGKQKPGALFEKKEFKKFLLHKNAQSIEDVFIAWMGELLYLFYTEGLIMKKADIQRLDSEAILADVSGPIFNPESYQIKTEIKAVTYHELEVQKTDKGYQAQIIFDI
ncbi:MAG: archease [Candidatus Omnitrophica bacterium]|nr:archease [Candidatus Omnitrophota bacterium]MBU1871468.1 archease [Candidatus Omnitrophota bacterium]